MSTIISCLKELNNGDLVSGSIDTTIRIWHEGVCIKTVKGHNSTVKCIDLLEDGKLVSCDDHSIRVWQ